MICPPLAVCAGDRLKLPHSPTLPQLAVQLTPRCPVSPVVVAASVVCVPVGSDSAGGEEMVTTMGAAITMLAVAEEETAGFAVDFAVMVTVPPGGTTEGAAYVAALPLAVWAVIVPHDCAPHCTDQSTPAVWGSLATIAVIWTVCAVPAVCAYTLDGATLTVTGGGEDGVVIVRVTLADLLVSVTDVATIVTVLPAGTTEGAVYTDWPDVDTAGLNDPQAIDPQVAV